MRLELIVELILVQILLMLLLLPKHIIVLLLMMLLQVMVLKNGAHLCYVLVSTFSSTSSKYFLVTSFVKALLDTDYDVKATFLLYVESGNQKRIT